MRYGQGAKACAGGKCGICAWQMKERELENIMLDFINGEIDVLVSTTIIETGLIFPMQIQ